MTYYKNSYDEDLKEYMKSNKWSNIEYFIEDNSETHKYGNYVSAISEVEIKPIRPPPLYSDPLEEKKQENINDKNKEVLLPIRKEKFDLERIRNSIIKEFDPLKKLHR